MCYILFRSRTHQHYFVAQVLIMITPAAINMQDINYWQLNHNGCCYDSFLHDRSRGHDLLQDPYRSTIVCLSLQTSFCTQQQLLASTQISTANCSSTCSQLVVKVNIAYRGTDWVSTSSWRPDKLPQNLTKTKRPKTARLEGALLVVKCHIHIIQVLV